MCGIILATCNMSKLTKARWRAAQFWYKDRKCNNVCFLKWRGGGRVGAGGVGGKVGGGVNGRVGGCGGLRR